MPSLSISCTQQKGLNGSINWKVCAGYALPVPSGNTSKNFIKINQNNI